MRKSIKYIILFISLFFILSTTSMANTSVGYEIESYDVKINVNEDNTFDIEETITANFYEERSGITRTFKNFNTIRRDDGSVSFNFARISDIKVSEDYQLKKELNRTLLRIGNEGEKVKGLQTYTISYTYDIGNDPLKDMDEFYFNIVKNDTNTIIHNSSFEIVMPKEFDKDKMKILYGIVVDSQKDSLTYSISDNKIITGKYEGILKADESINIRIELPEDYFEDNNTVGYIVSGTIIVISICGLIISLVLWRKYGDDDPILKINTNTPPKGYNSAEVAFFYKGDVTKDDIMTLLLYLANKGYLKIEEYEESTIFVKERTFKLTKLKEYDGENEVERMFFEGIFRYDSKTITEKGLINQFYKTLDKVEKKIESEKNIQKVFESEGKSKGKIVALIGIIVLIISILIPMILEAGIYGVIVTILAVGFEIFGVYCFRLIRDLNFKKKHNIISALILGLLGGMLILTMSIYVMRLHSFMLYKVAYIIGLISYVIIRVIKHFMPKRTKFGTTILGEILGFKEYLEKVEKSELEQIVKENSNYFYDILPYAYVLNESDRLIKIIDDIGLNNKKPEWFNGIGEYTVKSLDDFYIRTINPEITTKE